VAVLVLLFLQPAAAQDPVSDIIIEAVVEEMLRQSYPIMVNNVLDTVVAVLSSVAITVGVTYLRQRRADRQQEQLRQQEEARRKEGTELIEGTPRSQPMKLRLVNQEVDPEGDTGVLPELVLPEATRELPAAPLPGDGPEPELVEDETEEVVQYNGGRMPEQLTKHFTMAEMCVTEVRLWAPKNRRAAEDWRDSLKAVAKMLEQVRELCGNRPIYVHSGYRHPKLNAAIGGSSSSQHCQGEAADFHISGVELPEVFDAIRASPIRFGQLLLEDRDDDGDWDHIHISLGHPWRKREDCGQVGLVRGSEYEWLERAPIS
jgi:zinc D-Ala-D-Ala carboxypeptidase